MTPQERQLLESLADRIASTSVSQKDPEADSLIRSRIGSKPDALYVLTQTALIQEIALNQANARLHQLQEQIDAHRGESNAQPTSFLGRLFGSGGPSRPAPAAPQPYPPAYDAPPYQPAFNPAAPNPGSSFLRSAAMTATGVAAGALAFEGIESLFGHHGGFGGGGSGFLGEPSETIVNNNYYEEPRAGEHDDSFLDSGASGSSQYNSSADMTDDRTDDITDTGYDGGSGDSGDDFSSTDV